MRKVRDKRVMKFIQCTITVEDLDPGLGLIASLLTLSHYAGFQMV